MALGPDDLRLSAASVVEALRPAKDADWSVPAGDIGWTCRRTLDHITDALLLYAGHLASRATSGLPSLREGDASASPGRLLGVLESAAAVLADVAATTAALPGTRAYHPCGMADPEGFCAMGCDEILVHGWDIGRGLGVDVHPPEELAERVVERLFPWAPAGGGDVLLWANGRMALPDAARLDSDWYWHCAPLDEWDGTRRQCQVAPRWR